MSIASSASEDGWVPTVYDSVEKVKGTAENKRTVCCVIPYDSSSRSVLMISSQKKPGMWTLPKGGKEEGEPYAEAALREAWEEGGILGYITSECICQIDTERNHVFFYPLQVSEMKSEWPENGRGREWVSVEEAIARAYWRPEQAEALQAFSTWRDTLVESDASNESSESGVQLSPPGGEWTPRRLLAQLSRSLPATGPLTPARSYRFLASVPPPAAPSPASTSAPPASPPAVAPAEPSSTSSDHAPPSSAKEPFSPAATSAPPADAAASRPDPVRLMVPEAVEGRTLLGSSAQPLMPKLKTPDRRRLKRQREQLQVEPTTDIGRLIRAAPIGDRVWTSVLVGSYLTMAQKLEYLADPASHAAYFPETTRPEQWLQFVGQFGLYLNPSNPMLRPPDDVRSDQLRLGVARILQYQQVDHPILLLRLLRLAHITNVASSRDIWNTLVGIVKSTRHAWWTNRDHPPFDAETNPMHDVDQIRHRLLSDGIADAWDQNLVLAPVRVHRRRLATFLDVRLTGDLSVPAAQATDKPSVDYVSSFLTPSAIQHATDPVVLLYLLQGYLSTAPSERGQAYFDATLALVPDLARDWTPESQRAIKESIQTSYAPGDIQMYTNARQLLRRSLAPYLGSLADLWRGVFPIPRDMGAGVVSHKEYGATLREARRRGEDPYAPGGDLDWNLERTPKLNSAQRAQRRERAIPDGRSADGAAFGLRPRRDDSAA